MSGRRGCALPLAVWIALAPGSFACVPRAAVASPGSLDSGLALGAGSGLEGRRESFKTDLFTGAASLFVPIVIPPGTSDFQPKLELRYSSQRGDSWVAWGWDLGFGAIQRDTRFGVPDYDDTPATGDRFAWDDDRLVRDDAGSYHRARESFERIVRVDGPDGRVDHWRVHRTDGTTLWFGSDAGARVIDPATGVAFAWHLARAEDRHGNFIRYSYQTPTPSSGSLYPWRIEYGFRDESPDSPTLRSLEFQLELRPDPRVVFVGGVERRLAHRLSAIDVRRGGLLVTRYELEHADEGGMPPPSARSTLRRIVRVGADAVSTLPAETFAYSGDAGPDWGAGSEAAALALRLGELGGAGFNLETSNWSILDVNGDAAGDVVFTSGSSSDARVWIHHREHVVVDGIDVPFLHLSSSANTPVYGVPALGNLSVHVARPWTHWVDYSADGRTDLALGLRNLTSGQSLVVLWRNSSWSWSVEDPTSGFAAPPADLYTYRTDCGPFLLEFARSALVDVNGDALPDLVSHRLPSALHGDCAAPFALESWSLREVFLNGGEGWQTAPDPAWSAQLAAALDALGVRLDELLWLDLNGDGWIDLASDVDRDGAVDGSRVLVHDGRGWRDAAALGFAVPPGLRPVDLDGDGLVDHAGSPPLFNTGTAFLPDARLPALPAPFDAPGGSEAFVDLDGDGRVDLLSAPQGGPVTLLLSSEGSSGEGPAGLLVEVARPEGGRLRLAYEATTASSCYGGGLGGCHADFASWSVADLREAGLACHPPLRLDGTSCEFPLQRLPLGVQTLRAVESVDGMGNTATDWTHFDRGLYSAAEREFRGFGLVSELPQPFEYANPRTGSPETVALLRETRFYQLDFLRGAPAVVDTFGFPGGSSVRLERRLNQFAITRGDLSGTALLQGETYDTACDLDDPNAVETPPASGCDVLVDLETSVYGALALPQPLPYAAFRAQFGASNPDRGQAYLVLPVATLQALYDGDVSNPELRLSERWHDGFGNVQLDWDHGRLGEPQDDRITLREFASVVAGGVEHLRALPSRTAVQSASGAVLLEEDRFLYDGLAEGLVAVGNLTRQLSGVGLDQAAVDRVFGAGSYGLPQRVSDPYGPGETPRFLELDYDPSHTFLIRTTRAGLSLETRYDPAGAPPGLGLVRETLDANGAAVTYTADAFGRRLTRAGPAPIGLAEQRSYDDFEGLDPNRPRLIVTLHAGTGVSVATRTYTDGLGRAIRVERDGLDADDQPARIVQRIRYDPQGRRSFLGRMHFAHEPEGGGTTTRYDERGRVRFLIDPAGGVIEHLYDKLSEVVLDATGGRIERLRDPRGAVVSVRERLGGHDYETQYFYDPLGRLRAVCDALATSCPSLDCSQGSCDTTGGDPRHSTHIDFDTLGRKTRLVDPDQGTLTYAYDARGKLVRQTDARGVELAFVYEPEHGRLSCEAPTGSPDCAGADTLYTYGDQLGSGAPPGSLGRLVSVASPGGTQVYTYDTRGRIVGVHYEPPEGGEGWVVSTSYDWLDRPTSTTYPDGETLVRDYDRMGVDRVYSSDRTYLADVRHAADGRPSLLERGNGTSRVLDYRSDVGWLERILDTPNGGGTSLVDYTFDYDARGRIRHRFDWIDLARSITNVTYDELGRLTSAQAGPVPRTWRYDVLGNLVERDGVALPYEHPAKPHALFDALDPQRFGYDAAGNMTRRRGWTHVYDSRSRLAFVDEPLALSLLYDHVGERTRAERGAAVTSFLGPDLQLLGVRRPGFGLQPSLRYVKTIRAAGMLVARVATPGSGATLSASGLALDARAPASSHIFGPLAFGLAPAVLGLGVVVASLLARRARGLPLRAAAGAGGATTLLYLGQVVPALAQISDGDVNSDGRLDVADALLCERIAVGDLTPSAGQALRADVAPLEAAPESPVNVDVADLLLVLRAAAGQDVDADGVPAGLELALGTSPFRADSDGDGRDDAELAWGDVDADGWTGAAEVSAGTDPLDPDTDGDGRVDSRDPDPLVAEGTRVEWLHTDHLGSVVVVTDDAGLPTGEIEYDPWGAIQNSSAGQNVAPGGSEAFTGQRWDPSVGLVYLGARYYDPELGRFLQPDSFVPEPLEPQMLNRYAYVLNDPLNAIDPTGNVPQFVQDASRFFGSALGSARDGLVGGLQLANHYVANPLLRTASTLITSAAALGASVVYGLPLDVAGFARAAWADLRGSPRPLAEHSAYERARARLNRSGGLWEIVGGVGSGVGQVTQGYFMDMLEFALIDNIGNNFPTFGRMLAKGFDGDARRLLDRLANKLAQARGSGDDIQILCSSQGCAKLRFALDVLAQRKAELSNIHVSAYGGATRFSEVLRSRLGSYDSYANPGDVFVALPYGERVGVAQRPPILNRGQSSILPARSHEFGSYCLPLGTC